MFNTSLDLLFIPKKYTDKLLNFYFDINNGAIIHTVYSAESPRSDENAFFRQLKKNVNIALLPLIELIKKSHRMEKKNYFKINNKYPSFYLPQNHPANIFEDLLLALKRDEKFLGIYKNQFLPKFRYPYGCIDMISRWAQQLADLTHTDVNQTYNLLKKINACKNQFHFIDPWEFPISFYLENKQNNPHQYQSGIEKITNFFDLQCEIEEDIKNIISNFHRPHPSNRTL